MKAENLNHSAIIPDGNRRWAKEKGFEASYGHSKGGDYEHLRGLLDEARKLGIKYVSFWGFSTENWARGKLERNAIFNLILKSIKRFREDALKNKTRFRHIGRRDRLPESLLSELEKIEEETKNFSDFNVMLCLDYGGRDEIVRAINRMIKEGVKQIDEKEFAKYLDTAEIPEPDMIIRTAGEKRLSGFMAFQSAYAELYFSEVYFPDFDAGELRKAVEDFKKRKRNFGN